MKMVLNAVTTLLQFVLVGVTILFVACVFASIGETMTTFLCFMALISFSAYVASRYFARTHYNFYEQQRKRGLSPLFLFSTYGKIYVYLFDVMEKIKGRNKTLNEFYI